MSLTRDEWEEMWEAAQRLQHIADRMSVDRPFSGIKIKKEVKIIKDKIQQVIGQME